MRKNLKFVFPLLLITLLISCENEIEQKTDRKNYNLEELFHLNNSKITIKQGIAGTLTMKEGNCMPMIGIGGNCITFPVQRTIRVYEYTTLKEVKGHISSYDAVSSKLVGKTETDADGFYQIGLPPGKFSLFIMEKNKFYANGLDGQGGINPISIEKDSVTIGLFNIDYAVY